MHRSQHVTVSINTSRIAENAKTIAKQTGVDLIAVVKADAYGLGIRQIAAALTDSVAAFYVFDLTEAINYRLYELTGKPTIALLCESNNPNDYLPQHIRPAIMDLNRAKLLATANPLLCVDSGQGRFGCDPVEALQILEMTSITEVFTHATTPQHLSAFKRFVQSIPIERRKSLRIHAAGTSLMNDASARFDAVRPGLALYKNAVHLATTLIEVRNSGISAGYTGFISPRYGLIRCGYSNQLKPGVCIVNGTLRKILEVGMQSAFVEIGPMDKPGDEVTLLGDALNESQLSLHWQCSPQEVLLRLCSSGQREYIQSGLNSDSVSDSKTNQ